MAFNNSMLNLIYHSIFQRLHGHPEVALAVDGDFGVGLARVPDDEGRVRISIHHRRVAAQRG